MSEFYDAGSYVGYKIRNECKVTERQPWHWHTILAPDVQRPGNWLGVVVKCGGDLSITCQRVDRVAGLY